MCVDVVRYLFFGAVGHHITIYERIPPKTRDINYLTTDIYIAIWEIGFYRYLTIMERIKV